MSKSILVVAPHPDDETLGCGGTLLRLQADGYALHWAIATRIENPALQEKREPELEQVSRLYGFAQVFRMGLPTARVDEASTSELVGRFSSIMRAVQPEIVLLPYSRDAHSDHYHVGKAALACCKWFRYPGIRQVLVYETPSETNFNLDPADPPLRLNCYYDITAQWEKKLEILRVYESELGEFPFPRGIEAVEALAKLRGSECGVRRAEAFSLLRGVY